MRKVSPDGTISTIHRGTPTGTAGGIPRIGLASDSSGSLFISEAYPQYNHRTFAGWCAHSDRRYRSTGIFRRWRPRQSGSTCQTQQHFRRRRGQPILHRLRQCPSPENQLRRNHHNDCQRWQSLSPRFNAGNASRPLFCNRLNPRWPGQHLLRSVLDREDYARWPDIDYLESGTYSFGGNGGPAINAQLWEPSYIALDGAGNVFISDTANQMIRRVDNSGIISIVAGNGNHGYGAMVAPPSALPSLSRVGIGVDNAGTLYIATRVTIAYA